MGRRANALACASPRSQTGTPQRPPGPACSGDQSSGSQQPPPLPRPWSEEPAEMSLTEEGSRQGPAVITLVSLLTVAAPSVSRTDRCISRRRSSLRCP